MKKNRSSPYVILLFILLLSGSGVLAYRFLESLGQGRNPIADFGSFLASLGAQGSSGPQSAAGRSGDQAVGDRGLAGAGRAAASDRKWVSKTPPFRVSGKPISLNEPNRRALSSSGFIGGLPLYFEDCLDYGGEFDFLNSGSFLDFFVTPGLACIDMQRPEVEINENAKLVYTIDTSTGEERYDACELERDLKICLNMADVSPHAGSRSADQAGGRGSDVAIGPDGLLPKWHADFTRDSPQDSVRLEKENEQGDESVGRPAEGRNNYWTGSDPKEWFYDLPGFARARLRDVVPGVDMACYADQSRLEYLFTFWPGADPEDTLFAYNDSQNVELLSSGNVAVDYPCARVLHHRPMAYHWKDGRPHQIESYYEANGNSITLRVEKPLDSNTNAEKDKGTEPPPDPYLEFLTHYGGSGRDIAYAICHDAKGLAHMAGSSTSPSFSTPSRAPHPVSENTDAFVLRFPSANHERPTMTFFGGSHDDRAFSIVADDAGNSYVCGETISPDFPAIGAPETGVSGRGWDAFIIKLNGQSGEIEFGYRIGGSGDDRAYGIALDADGNILLVGMTGSDDFPAGPDGAQAGPAAAKGDAFLIKIAANGSELLGGSRFGGSDSDHAFAVAVDHESNVYVVGETRSDDFPITRAFQNKRAGKGWDAFAVKFSPDLKSHLYATFIGGSNDDHAYGVAVDLAGHAYIVGETSSGDFPVGNALQEFYGGGDWDGFLIKLNPSGGRAVYATYIGGSDRDRVNAVTADVDGHIFFGGSTASTNLPTLRAIQPTYGGGPNDGFVGRINPTGLGVDYISYIGAEGNDSVNAISLHTIESVVFAGMASSSNLVVHRPMQSAHRGQEDTLIGRIMSEAPPAPDMRLVKAMDQPGGPAYDFYVGSFEVTNDEFVRFLNDAHANPSTERGTNLHFAANGDVWFNTNMVPNSQEILSLKDSRIVYQPQFPVGSRYGVSPVLPAVGESYGTHPVVGVSWYGAVKYCNWLTIATGRGTAERCFREGPSELDWAPVSCSPTNWARGRFTAGEREAWLKYSGFRMPMDNCGQEPVDSDPMFLVTRREFARFLNSAQSDPRSLRGMHIEFDEAGNVAITQEEEGAETFLFRLENSGMNYNANAPVGSRYGVNATPDRRHPDSDPARGPVKNVSWYGAVKYCNWLSLEEGQPVEELSYREGPGAAQWAAASISNDDWVKSHFTEQSKKDWLTLKGHKLPYQSPLVDTNQIDTLAKYIAATNSYPNAYNEFYKAAAWNGTTNGVYGFGRSETTPADANFLNSGLLRIHDTASVGFFNGSDHDGKYPTATNQNRYGVFDLSGNVEEWLVDPGVEGTVDTRACYGGSWLFPLPSMEQRFFVHPYFTDNFRGFRVLSTKATEEMYAIRIPFRICICGYGVGDGCGRDEVERGSKGVDPPKMRKGTRLTIDSDEGETTGTIPKPGEEEDDGDVEDEEGGGGIGASDQDEDGPIESVSGDGDVSGDEDEQ